MVSGWISLSSCPTMMTMTPFPDLIYHSGSVKTCIPEWSTNGASRKDNLCKWNVLDSYNIYIKLKSNITGTEL